MKVKVVLEFNSDYGYFLKDIKDYLASILETEFCESHYNESVEILSVEEVKP